MPLFDIPFFIFLSTHVTNLVFGWCANPIDNTSVQMVTHPHRPIPDHYHIPDHLLRSEIVHQEAAFEPRPVAEAKQSSVEISQDAPISRLRPIHDGLDYWQEHRSSAVPGSGRSARG
jgi:hypothetical protein